MRETISFNAVIRDDGEETIENGEDKNERIEKLYLRYLVQSV